MRSRPHSQADEAAEVAIPGAAVQVVEIGEDAALRSPGRAGRVEQAALGLEAGRAGARRPRRRRERRRHRLRVHHRQRPPRARATVSRSATRRGDDHGQVGLGVVHLVEHLVVPVVGVDRHDAAAERVQRQVVEEELGAILEQQRHPVAVAVAGRGVPLAQPQALRLRPRVAVLHAGRVIGPARSGRRREEGVVGRGPRRRREGLEDRAHQPRRRHGLALSGSAAARRWCRAPSASYSAPAA